MNSSVDRQARAQACNMRIRGEGTWPMRYSILSEVRLSESRCGRRMTLTTRAKDQTYTVTVGNAKQSLALHISRLYPLTAPGLLEHRARLLFVPRRPTRDPSSLVTHVPQIDATRPLITMRARISVAMFRCGMSGKAPTARRGRLHPARFCSLLHALGSFVLSLSAGVRDNPFGYVGGMPPRSNFKWQSWSTN